MTASDLNTEQIKKIMTDFESTPDGKTQIPEELLESVHKVIVGMFFWSVLKIFYKDLNVERILYAKSLILTNVSFINITLNGDILVTQLKKIFRSTKFCFWENGL